MTLHHFAKQFTLGLTIVVLLPLSPVWAQDFPNLDLGDVRLVQAGPGMGNGFEPGQRRFQSGDPQGRRGFLSELNLSPEQKEKLKTLMQSQRQQVKGNHQALRQKRQQLREMLQSGSGSREEALAIHREIAQQQTAMMEQRITMLYALREILTPEQFTKFRSLMEQRRQNRSGGPGGRFKGRRPAGTMGQQ